MPTGSNERKTKRTKTLDEYQRLLRKDLRMTSEPKDSILGGAIKEMQRPSRKEMTAIRKKVADAPEGVRSNKTYSNKFPSKEDTMDGWRSIGKKGGVYQVDNGGHLQVKKIQVTPGKWTVKNGK